MKEINYTTVIEHLKSMINILEFDSMRSAGKAKLNAPHLDSMYNLVDRYTAEMSKVKKAEVKAIVKEEK